MRGGRKYIKWRSSIPESNKSLSRSESYVKDNTQLYNDKMNFHLSLDDTINIFKDITDNENRYLSIFENPMLGWLKSLHQETGVKVSCYVFLSDGIFHLHSAPRSLRMNSRQLRLAVFWVSFWISREKI